MSGDHEMFKLNSELRSDARNQLAGNWGKAILSCLIYSIITGAVSGAGGIVGLIIGGPMELGLVAYFLKLKRQGDPQLEVLFQGFRRFESSLVAYIVRMVFVLLWSLLLFVPGIIAALRYSMALYILHDNPQLSGTDAINKSKEMMDGFKGKLFGLYLSFVGWGVLCVLTLGVGFLWLFPYIKASEAHFYEELKNRRQ